MLSDREKEVLRYLPEGKSNKEIAKMLGVCERTIKAHITSAMKKVNKNNRVLLAIGVYSGEIPCGS